MENINAFINACKKYGVPDIDLLKPVDLFEKRNAPQVLQCLMGLARTVGIFFPYFTIRHLAGVNLFLLSDLSAS